jgi:hypothetical protein
MHKKEIKEKTLLRCVVVVVVISISFFTPHSYVQQNQFYLKYVHGT